jgi:hypothetical protein
MLSTICCLAIETDAHDLCSTAFDMHVLNPLLQPAAGARDVVHSASMPPHIYLVAANAFRRMLRERSSQSLIVNGR